jgi:hypothetical protein
VTWGKEQTIVWVLGTLDGKSERKGKRILRRENSICKGTDIFYSDLL